MQPRTKFCKPRDLRLGNCSFVAASKTACFSPAAPKQHSGQGDVCTRPDDPGSIPARVAPAGLFCWPPIKILGANAMTPAGLEPAIPGSVGRCLIHWATGPCDIRQPLESNSSTASCGSFIVSAWVRALLSERSAFAGRYFPQTGSEQRHRDANALGGGLRGGAGGEQAVIVIVVVARLGGVNGCLGWLRVSPAPPLPSSPFPSLNCEVAARPRRQTSSNLAI